MSPKILVERQGKKILVWVDHELICEFNGRTVGIAGKPLEIAEYIKLAFLAVGIEAKLEADIEWLK